MHNHIHYSNTYILFFIIYDRCLSLSSQLPQPPWPAFLPGFLPLHSNHYCTAHNLLAAFTAQSAWQCLSIAGSESFQILIYAVWAQCCPYQILALVLPGLQIRVGKLY
jgi:hypothetical protein